MLFHYGRVCLSGNASEPSLPQAPQKPGYLPDSSSSVTGLMQSTLLRTTLLVLTPTYISWRGPGQGCVTVPSYYLFGPREHSHCLVLLTLETSASDCVCSIYALSAPTGTLQTPGYLFRELTPHFSTCLAYYLKVLVGLMVSDQ